MMKNCVIELMQKKINPHYLKSILFLTGCFLLCNAGNAQNVLTNDDVRWESDSVLVKTSDGEPVNGGVKWTDDNGNLIWEGNFKNGLQKGAHRQYEGGVLLSIIRYRKGEPKGKFEAFYPNKNLRIQGRFRKGGRHGTWTWMHPNGETEQEGKYEEGLRTGEWSGRHPNGNLSFKGTYEADQETGMWFRYYPDGELSEEGRYINAEKVGNWRFYHPNAALAKEGEYVGGERHGMWRFYHPNTVLESEGRYENDLRSDTWYFYSPEGVKMEQGTYELGKKTGMWSAFHADGRMKEVGSYRNGERNGTWRSFHADGALASASTFKDGELTGVFKAYYPNGNPESYGLYESGQRQDIWRLFTPDGDLREILEYQNGRAVNRWQANYESQEKLSMLVMGDYMQHDPQIEAAKRGEGYTYDHYFEYITDWVSSVDVAIANLEVTLGGPPYTGYPQFSAPDAYAAAIRDAGFDILTTANNHSNDRKRAGMVRTLDVLDSLQVRHLGTYRDSTERRIHYPMMVNHDGIKVALLNYTYGTNGIATERPGVVNMIDPEMMKNDIAEAMDAKPDKIIAIMHWGTEYLSAPDSYQRKWGEWLLEQGVDLVIGGHPHWVQPMELRKDENGEEQLIVWSLGNAVSNQRRRHTDGGATIQFSLERDRRGEVHITDVGYHLHWVRIEEEGELKNYKLLPVKLVESGLVELNEEEQKAFDRFVDDERNSTMTNNINVPEYKMAQTFYKGYLPVW